MCVGVILGNDQHYCIFQYAIFFFLYKWFLLGRGGVPRFEPYQDIHLDYYLHLFEYEITLFFVYIMSATFFLFFFFQEYDSPFGLTLLWDSWAVLGFEFFSSLVNFITVRLKQFLLKWRVWNIYFFYLIWVVH